MRPLLPPLPAGEGQTGLCRARANRGGRIVPLGYARLTSLALDPIEKKPLRRFRPGQSHPLRGQFRLQPALPLLPERRDIYRGRGLSCARLPAGRACAAGPRLRTRGNIGLAYTYNEPLVGFEYIRDCAALARKAGLVNVLVTNGTVEPEPWQELLPLIDAVNIDLKGFTEDWYRRLGGDLSAVMRSIELAARACHLEVTTLLVPGCNDGEHEMRELTAWARLHKPRDPPCTSPVSSHAT